MEAQHIIEMIPSIGFNEILDCERAGVPNTQILID